jgi:endonuclease/exonuclease/phosphatase family metal-dependent hydrolase
VPVIALGDLNAPPGDPVLAALESAGLRSALPPDSGATAHGFTGRQDGPPIDHILVSHHWTVCSAAIARHAGTTGTFPSDHWPVVADLLLV